MARTWRILTAPTWHSGVPSANSGLALCEGECKEPAARPTTLLTVASAGAVDDRVQQRGHDRLSVFGIVAADEAPLLQPLSRALQARGCLVANEHGGLKLAGDARKSFMSGCLSGKPAAAAPQTPQERMKSCNAQATTQKVTGDQRKTFMSTCLRG